MAKDIPIEQLMAINMRFRLGRKLQENYGEEIKSLYSGGYTLSQIVDKLEIHEKYSISDHLARNSIYTAITGHDGKFNVSSYNGLFSEEERERIGKEHMVEAGKKNGKSTYENDLGIFSFSKEERRAFAAKGGRIGGKKVGKKCYEEKIGIHGLSHEERSKNGTMGAIAKGYTLWSNEEKERVYELSLKEEYQNGKYTKSSEIAKILNEEYHQGREIRKNNTVSLCLIGIRKKKAKESGSFEEDGKSLEDILE